MRNRWVGVAVLWGCVACTPIQPVDPQPPHWHWQRWGIWEMRGVLHIEEQGKSGHTLPFRWVQRGRRFDLKLLGPLGWSWVHWSGRGAWVMRHDGRLVRPHSLLRALRKHAGDLRLWRRWPGVWFEGPAGAHSAPQPVPGQHALALRWPGGSWKVLRWTCQRGACFPLRYRWRQGRITLTLSELSWRVEGQSVVTTQGGG